MNGPRMVANGWHVYASTTACLNQRGASRDLQQIRKEKFNMVYKFQFTHLMGFTIDENFDGGSRHDIRVFVQKVRKGVWRGSTAAGNYSQTGVILRHILVSSLIFARTLRRLRHHFPIWECAEVVEFYSDKMLLVVWDCL